MPSFELPIRSLAILFIFGSLIAMLWFPNNPVTPNLARALFWWFLGLGAVRWVENALFDILPVPQRDRNDRLSKNSDRFWYVLRYLIGIISFGLMVWFLIIGVQYFFSALEKL